MGGETQAARQLISSAMAQADADPHMDRDSMGRAIINAVIEHYFSYRKLSDIQQELQYTIDNLDADDFVITRGC